MGFINPFFKGLRNNPSIYKENIIHVPLSKHEIKHNDKLNPYSMG